MTRISRKNAARIRRGIKAGRDAIAANHAGLPHISVHIEDKLERRAYYRTLRAEVNRIAQRALRAAKRLRGEK